MAFTKAGIRSELERLNRDYSGQRTWGQAYGAINLAEQSAMANVEQDYAASMNQAYQSALQNKAAVAGSNVGTGYKTEAIASIDEALASAYDRYLQNYLQGRADIAENMDAYRGTVTKNLEQQADYVQRYEQAHWDYLRKMYEMHQKGELEGGGYYDPFEEANWKKYLNITTDEAGVETEAGLMNEALLLSKFMDNEGNLTQAGVDFYEQMEQDMAQRSDVQAYTFQDYLRGEKQYKDLPEWANTQYAFSYDPTTQGDTTGQSMFNTMFGRMSQDNVYTFAERKYGMTSGQLERSYEPFKSAVENLNTLMADSASAKKVDAAFDEVIAQYDKLAKDFNYTDNSLRDQLEELKRQYRAAGSGDAGEVIGSTLAGGMGGFLAATGGAAAAGSSAGPIGAAIGALVGAIGFGIQQGVNTYKQTRADEENARAAYNAAIAAFLNQQSISTYSNRGTRSGRF